MAQLFSNNAITLLASPLGTGDAFLTVASGTGHLFPTIANASDFFIITIENQLGTEREVIGIGGRTGDTLNIISRGLEGTTAQSWSVNSTVEIRMTAGALNSHTSAMNVISQTMANGFASSDVISTDTNQRIQDLVEIVEQLTSLNYQMLSNMGIKHGTTGAMFIDVQRSGSNSITAPFYVVDGGIQSSPFGTSTIISNAHSSIYQSQAGNSLIYSAISFS